MADITIQKFSDVGLTPSFTAASAGGDTLMNDGVVYLFVKNGAAAAVTVTVDSLLQCDQGHDHDLTYSVAAGTTSQLGPFSKARFNNAEGDVTVNYSDATSVTVAAVKTY